MNSHNVLPASKTGEAERREVDKLLDDLRHAGYVKYAALNSCFIGTLILSIGLVAILHETGFNGLLYPYSIFVVVFALCWTLIRNRLGSVRRAKITLHLVKYNDVRVIGPLLTALGWPDALAYERSFRRALTRLLPQLTTADALLLTDEHRARLHRELSQPDADYCNAILKALEQIGDGSSLEYIRPLAEGLPLTTDPNSVRQAAKECLQILSERAEKRQAKERLLRASTIEQPDTLLHPASGSGKEDTKQLLRTGQSEETDPGGQR